MRFSHAFIDRPILAAVLSILITLIGLASYFDLPVAQYPEIAPPVVTVTEAGQPFTGEVVEERGRHLPLTPTLDDEVQIVRVLGSRADPAEAAQPPGGVRGGGGPTERGQSDDAAALRRHQDVQPFRAHVGRVGVPPGPEPLEGEEHGGGGHPLDQTVPGPFEVVPLPLGRDAANVDHAADRHEPDGHGDAGMKSFK
mgnify:CR=1 FL=1